MLDRGSSTTSDPLFCQIPARVSNTTRSMTVNGIAFRESAGRPHPRAKLCA